MDIGNARIGASGAVYADIIGIFAPAHRADRRECHLPRALRLLLPAFALGAIVNEERILTAADRRCRWIMVRRSSSTASRNTVICMAETAKKAIDSPAMIIARR